MKKGLLLVVVMLATIAVTAQATLLLLKLLRKLDTILMKHGHWVLN